MRFTVINQSLSHRKGAGRGFANEQRIGEVFTKEQIYQAVWESDYLLDDSNIMAFIRKLRKKIEPNPDAPEYILTIWGIGYKFNDKTE